MSFPEAWNLKLPIVLQLKPQEEKDHLFCTDSVPVYALHWDDGILRIQSSMTVLAPVLLGIQYNPQGFTENNLGS